MPFEARDNSGSLWSGHGYSGKAIVKGEGFAVGLIAFDGGGTTTTPSHMYVLNNREHSYSGVLYRPRTELAKAVATGIIKELGVRMNVFKIDEDRRKSDNSPVFSVSFRDVDDQSPPTPQEDETQVQSEEPF